MTDEEQTEENDIPTDENIPDSETQEEDQIDPMPDMNNNTNENPELELPIPEDTP